MGLRGGLGLRHAELNVVEGEDRSENVSDELSQMIEEHARSGPSRAARGNREEMEARSTRREAVGQLANGSGRFGKGDMCGVEKE